VKVNRLRRLPHPQAVIPEPSSASGSRRRVADVQLFDLTYVPFSTKKSIG